MGHFDPFHASKHTVIPGLGTIFTQGVANAYVHWLEHQFKAEGADDQVRGRILFGAAIQDDGTVIWNVEEITGPATRRLGYKDPRPTELDQTDFPAKAVARMRLLSETYEERDPTGWFFHVHDRAVHDLGKLKRQRDDLVRGIAQFKELLADPSEPRTHFVSAAEAGADKGHSRTATQEERAERRDLWRSRLERDERRLVEHDAAFGARTRTLERIRAALRTWSSRDARRAGGDMLPSQLVAEAVASHMAA